MWHLALRAGGALLRVRDRLQVDDAHLLGLPDAVRARDGLPAHPTVRVLINLPFSGPRSSCCTSCSFGTWGDRNPNTEQVKLSKQRPRRHDATGDEEMHTLQRRLLLHSMERLALSIGGRHTNTA